MYGKGKFISECGLMARVTTLRCIRKEWFLVGVFETEDSNVLSLHVWDLVGRSITGNYKLDLIERQIEENTER